MFSIEIECPPDETGLLIADLSEAGAAGIVELSDTRLRAFFADDQARNGIAGRFHAVTSRLEEQRDWVAESRANWEPMLIGSRFFLVPEWRDDPAQDGRFRIVVNPGMAFGTGRHETTQLCLEALETYVRSGEPMLDIGTGAGILARGAVLLGATPVWASDIDPDAVEVSRLNLLPNLFIGSANAVRSRSAAILTANISPEAILTLAPDLLRCLRPDGVALLSGFEGWNVPAVEAALASLGARIIETRHKNEWALLAVGVTLDGGN